MISQEMRQRMHGSGGRMLFYQDNQIHRLSPLTANLHVTTSYLFVSVYITCEHAAWLEEGQIIKNAHSLADIPDVLIHGLLDLTRTSEIAKELRAVWADAKLVLLYDAGHLASPSRRSRLVEALEGFT